MLKAVSSITNAIGALNYKGTWDASTNTPSLASSVGTKGDYYVVSVAGSTNLNGETNWQIGDWATFNGSAWQKVDGGSTGLLTTLTVTGSASIATTSGQLTVGTASPSGMLTVSSPASTIYGSFNAASDGFGYLTLKNNGTDCGYVGPGAIGNGNQMAISAAGATPVIFGTNSIERARITGSGDLLVGRTSNPTVSGITANNAFVSSTNNRWIANFRHTTATTPWGVAIDYTGVTPNNTDSNFLWCTDGTLRATIRSNGGLANYQSNNADLSDVRTKKEITFSSSMWSKISALEIVNYKYKDQTHDDVNIGVIAQQVESVEPAWVDTDGFGDTPEDGIPLKTVYTKDITFAAIKALQEAMQRIEDLELKVSSLEKICGTTI